MKQKNNDKTHSVRLLNTEIIHNIDDNTYNNIFLDMTFDLDNGNSEYILRYVNFKGKEKIEAFDNLKDALTFYNDLLY